MKNYIYTAIVCFFYLPAQSQISYTPTGVVNKFLEGLKTSDVRKIAPFLYDGLNFQIMEVDKNSGVNVKIYRRDTYLYAIDHTPKNTFTETFETGVGSNANMIATVWSNFNRTFKNGNRRCGNRVFNLILLQEGWQIVQVMETQFQDCSSIDHKTQTINLPLPMIQN
jgi:hypothetical protein